MLSPRAKRLGARIHAAFHEPDTQIYRVVQGVVWGLIFLSIVMLIVESMLPRDRAVVATLHIIDRIVLVLFALEYILRVGSYSPPALQVFKRGPFVQLRMHIWARIRYALQPMMLVDLLAVLAVFPELRGLRGLRLLRLLRTVNLFRYSNPVAAIFHALEENSLLFAVGFTVLSFETFIGGVSIYLVEKETNSSINSLIDGLWWALVTITTVGFGDITPATTLGRIIGGGLMVGGMFTLALFAGFVGSSLVTAMLSIREEQFRMGDYANHVVICGYDETTEMLLELVRKEIDTNETRVVVFEDSERPRELSPDYLWVQGDPTKQSELDKVRITHARAVIVVGSRELTPHVADARTILIIFTIRAYLTANPAIVGNRRSPLYVMAEILDAENVDHARTAGADEVIETRRLGFSMLAHAIRYRGTADTMSRVVMSGSYNAYVGVIPDKIKLPMLYGALLLELRLTERGGLIIGLRPPRGPEIFNPSKEQMVHPGTHLVYLSEAPILDPPE